MPIFSYTCTKCGNQEEKIFLTFKEAEEKQKQPLICPECASEIFRDEIQLPSRFMGCFGETWLTAPSKRHSYKKVNKEKTNAG